MSGMHTTRDHAVSRRAAIRAHLPWMLVLLAVVSGGCTDNPIGSSGVSESGQPASIALSVTVVSNAQPPTASIVATVRDPGSFVVSGVVVTFATSEGFITSGIPTKPDGVAVAILTGIAGTAPTVTVSATAVTDTTTVVTASTVVHF